LLNKTYTFASKKKVWETKSQAKIVKNFINCLDHGHTLGQINPFVYSDN